MQTFVPLISSRIPGQNGVLQVPRLWQKLSLEAQGKLAAGYPGAGQGFDDFVISGLGFDRTAAINYIKTDRPTYPQFEAWIAKQPGVKLDKGSVDTLNGRIIGYNHDDATRQAILAEAGIPDDANAPRDAVTLNEIEDRQAFYAAELK